MLIGRIVALLVATHRIVLFEITSSISQDKLEKMSTKQKEMDTAEEQVEEVNPVGSPVQSATGMKRKKTQQDEICKIFFPLLLQTDNNSINLTEGRDCYIFAFLIKSKI